ncbi:MAG: flagellar biosynthetic protein FliR [Alphaproteobacteria bacterium]
MLAAFLQGELFGYFLVFARLGAAIMLLPGFGESFVSPRIRLLLALAVTFAVMPIVADSLPAMPEQVLGLFVLLFGEILIGLFIGTLARILLGVLQSAGALIANFTSLGAAQVLDPASATPSTLPGNFLTILALVLIFATNLHHLMLAALVDSYASFPPGSAPPLDDFAEAASQLVAQGFGLAFQLAAPLLVVTLVMQIGLGLLARLMPQMQVFFVAMPLQILLGFAIVAVTLGAAMRWYLDRFAEPFALFGAG